MYRQPAVIQFGQSDLVPRKGTMTMNLVVISLKNFRVNLIGEIRNRLLSVVFRYYKSKRTPPVPG
ncbi:MAG: hypothetical protein E6330_04815 [Dialister sp.]|nr:hypothetical protein [Dialister sp.]